MNANELRHDLTLIEQNGFGTDADADSTIKEAAVAHLKLLEDRVEAQPWRYPSHYWVPGITAHAGGELTVEVGFPNEEPDTEDDRRLEVLFTSEGIIIDAYVSEDQLVESKGMTYEEWFDSLTGGNI